MPGLRVWDESMCTHDPDEIARRCDLVAQLYVRAYKQGVLDVEGWRAHILERQRLEERGR